MKQRKSYLPHSERILKFVSSKTGTGYLILLCLELMSLIHIGTYKLFEKLVELF